MINLSILISSSEVSGPGGLFDIDATLPLVAVQLLLLMVANELLLVKLSEVLEFILKKIKIKKPKNNFDENYQLI